MLPLSRTVRLVVVKLEGESPLRALVRRTVSEDKSVHRKMESEESRIQNVESKVRYLPGRVLVDATGKQEGLTNYPMRAVFTHDYYQAKYTLIW